MVGPILYLMRADSATVASVWSRNTTTKISASEAANGASWAMSPSTARLLRMILATARAPTSSGASAIRPCGASVTLKTATITATAAGHNRRVAIAFSTSIHAASAPNAMSGSGRRPLLNGSHAARNTAPAVQTATRFVARPPADRRKPAAADDQPGGDRRRRGGQPHPHAGRADRRQVREHRLIPVERRLGRAEEAVVIGRIATIARHPGDGQVVAVVGRSCADEVP